jgi:hypothetical protein
MRSIGLFILVSAVGLAQRPGGLGMSGVVRSGGTAIRPGINAPPSAPGFTGATAPGVWAGTGRVPVAGSFNSFNSFNFNRNFGGRAFGPRSSGAVVYVPYAVGGYTYYGPQEDYAAPMVYPNQPPPTPTVIINQNFVPQTANPMVSEYMTDEHGGIHLYQPGSPTVAQEGQPQQNAEPDNPTFLIAFKDHTIYAAVAYWVEGETLHYVTSGNRHNQVSLDLIDRELSDRLNSDRRVDFRLPPPGK